VATVPQRPYVFAGTIRDNLCLGRPGASQAQIEAAAHAASAASFIAALPAGYDTPVGEHGHTLSGGQAQRVALARAFLKDAPVVLIDEGTAGLDRDTEDDIVEAIERLARDRTVLLIAHRLQTVWRTQQVAVMEAGRIVETGPPRALAAADSRFARMIASAQLEP